MDTILTVLNLLPTLLKYQVLDNVQKMESNLLWEHISFSK